MSRPHPLDERGFTLVELVTTMGILMVVLTGITSLFVAGTRSQADLDRRFQAQTQLRIGLDRMRKDIHSACSAAGPPANLSTLSSVTLYMPSTCTSANAITWCTRGSGTRYALYRIVGTACTGGTRYADYLIQPSGTVFTYYTYNYPTGSYSLARLHVHLPDNVKGSGAGTYTFDDDIVFRNSPRCTIGTDCP